MQRVVRILDYVIYWSIVFYPFSMAIAPAFTGISTGFLFFAFFTKKIITQQKFSGISVIDLPYLVWVLVSLVSIVNSIDYQASIRGVFKLVQYALIYLILIREIKDKRHIERIVLAMILGGLLASVDSIWQIIWGKDFIRGNLPIINIGLKRATAGFPNANVLGVYLTAIAPFAFGLGLFYYKNKKRIYILIVGLLIMTGIILSFSRPAALAFYLSLLLLAIIKKKKIMVWGLIILLASFYFIAPRSIKEWAKEVNYNPIIFMCNKDRISIYKNTFNMIRHHPIIGVGLNTFSLNYFYYKLPEPDDAKTGEHMYAHNHFFQMAAEIGLLGLGVFLWLITRLFRQCAHLYKNLKDEFLCSICLCAGIGIFAFLVNGLTETSLYYSRVAGIFWYLVGFSLSQTLQNQPR
ncbi:MAG: O-antigen ligase family protein [Candidatus Omnitrophica bacterium]|nr:O-antigen ligase family protein [Candidatus Omnitrophota bacterium]